MGTQAHVIAVLRHGLPALATPAPCARTRSTVQSAIAPLAAADVVSGGER